MEQEKNNSGLVALVILLFLLVLGLGGYIIYDKFYNLKDDNVVTSNNNQNNVSNLYDNVEFDKETLDELYHIIGALPEADESIVAPRHCLNVAVTNTSHLGNVYAHDAFSWYVKTYDKQADYNKYQDAYYNYGDIEISAYQCADCITIEKNEVEKFKDLYYFVPEEEFKFIGEVVNYDNIYRATLSLGTPITCNYNVIHNITEVNVEKGIEGEKLYLTDEQIVTRYDDVENGEISQLTKQTINYSFYKKNGNDTYRLDHVFHRNKVK